jgi:hypothetical protein
MSREYPPHYHDLFEALDEVIEKQVKGSHISRGEAYMGFWTKFREEAKGQTNVEKKSLDANLIAFYCLEKVLELDPNDPVFFRSAHRGDLLRLFEKGPDYDPDKEVENARADVVKARVGLLKAQAEYDNFQANPEQQLWIRNLQNVIRDWMVLQSKDRYSVDGLQIGMRVLILPIWEYDNAHKIKYIESLDSRRLENAEDGVTLTDPAMEMRIVFQDPLLDDLLKYYDTDSSEVPALYEGKIKKFIQWTQIDNCISNLSKEFKLMGVELPLSESSSDSLYYRQPRYPPPVEISSTEEAYDGKIGYVKAVWDFPYTTEGIRYSDELKCIWDEMSEEERVEKLQLVTDPDHWINSKKTWNELDYNVQNLLETEFSDIEWDSVVRYFDKLPDSVNRDFWRDIVPATWRQIVSKRLNPQDWVYDPELDRMINKNDY